MTDDGAGTPRAWPRLASRAGEDMRLFRPRWDVLVNPRTGGRLERLVLEVPDWVNVVPVTADGRFVVVRQYRFGTGRVTTEIPGGAVDPGEDPLDAARRELREETGYEADEWTALGWVEPNPAFQDNRCHHFLARGASLRHRQEQDPGEDIAVAVLTEAELLSAIARGELAHALALTALARVLDLSGRPAE